MAVDTVSVSELYNTLEGEATSTLDDLFDRYDMSGADRAKVIANTINTLITTSVQATLQENMNAIQIEKGRYEIDNMLPIALAKATCEQEYTCNTKQDREDIVSQQLIKATNDATYVQAQEDALLAQVDDNRKIQVMQSYSDIYLGMSAGGVTPTSAQWNAIYSLGGAIVQGIDTGVDLGGSVLKQWKDTIYLCQASNAGQNGFVGLNPYEAVTNFIDEINNLTLPESGYSPVDGDYFKVRLIRYRTGAGTEGDPYVYHKVDIVAGEPNIDGNGDPYENGILITGGAWISGTQLVDDDPENGDITDSTNINGITGWKNADFCYFDGGKWQKLGRDWG